MSLSEEYLQNYDTDQDLKKEIGAENVGKMNQMMGQLQGMYQSGR